MHMYLILVYLNVCLQERERLEREKLERERLARKYEEEKLLRVCTCVILVSDHHTASVLCLECM